MSLSSLRGLLYKTRKRMREEVVPSAKWTRNYVAKKATKLSIDLDGEAGEPVTFGWVVEYELRKVRFADSDLKRALLVARVLGLSHEEVVAELLRN